jgi:Tfp pilus assembly protein PilF
LEELSELPAFLSKRRIERATAGGARSAAAQWLARGEVRLARKDQEGARDALQRAVAADESFVSAQMLLATLYEVDEEWDAAIERYRRIIAHAPENAVALNNLAYMLATRKNSPKEALPLAMRAFKAGNQDPAMTDTLAWVFHLLGQNLEAEPLILAAARRAPAVADIRLHAAEILAAVRKPEAARRELDQALRLDPTFAERPDVRRLQERLAKSEAKASPENVP